MSTETTRTERGAHRISIEARERSEIHGVTDVISFDESEVVLRTVCGELSVEGSALHIRVLNVEAGIVAMDGRVDSISYFDAATEEAGEKNGFFSKLFR